LHSISTFAGAYTELGGAANLGFPITEPFIEQSAIDGKGYWVQYFEKAVLEYHKDSTGADAYQLTPLGNWRFSHKYLGGAPPAKLLPGKASYHFSETDHTVS